jgi:hypothetical protein
MSGTQDTTALTSNVRSPRPYGDGRYGESIYGQWTGFYLTVPPPCAPTWTPKQDCGG